MRGGAGVMESIEHFGQQGRLFYIHFRDVKGACDPSTGSGFTECFIDEGNSDMFKVMLKLKEVGFKGFLIDDHVPKMVGDTPWNHRGRAFATGYMKGLLQAVNAVAQ
jgi:mannonate dehydratase